MEKFDELLELKIRHKNLKEIYKLKKGTCISCIVAGLFFIVVSLVSSYMGSFTPIDAFSITLLTCATHSMYGVYTDSIIPLKWQIRAMDSMLEEIENQDEQE